MLNEKVITLKQYNKAHKTPLGIRNFVSHSRSRFPVFSQTIKAELLKHFTSKQLSSHGLQIYTTLKPWIQRKAEKQLQKAISSLQTKQGKSIALQTAMIISEAHSSTIIAMMGDKNPKNTTFNRVTEIRRNIGSLVKPAIYLAAFKQGYTVNSLIDDSPIKVKLANGKYWYPKNFDHKSHGKVKLIRALSQSLNIASVRLGLTYGLDNVLQTLHLLGAKEELPIYPSVLLGAVSMSPYQVNQLYQTLANNGIYRSLTGIKGVLDKHNKTLSIEKAEPSLHFSNKNIAQIDQSLHQVVVSGTAKNIKKYNVKTSALKAKTGTSNKNRDSWFVGYNNDYVATVWLGNDGNKPIKYTGSSGAMLIWAKVMASIF
jgi:penicillin-binding protein 1B